MVPLIWKTLGALCLIQIIASLGYLAQTRCLPTPYSDSITDEQKALKDQTKPQRRKAYYVSLVIAMLIVGWLWYHAQ